MKIFNRAESVDKKELFTFWKSCTSGSGARNWLKDSATCDMGYFPQFGSYLCENWLYLHENFTTDISLNKEIATNFWKLSDSGVRIRAECALEEDWLFECSLFTFYRSSSRSSVAFRFFGSFVFGLNYPSAADCQLWRITVNHAMSHRIADTII